MSDAKGKGDVRDGRELRLPDGWRKPTATLQTNSVDNYALESQRRAIAYGRARGRS